MRERQIAEGKIDRERLDVLEILPSGGGVAIVADGHRTGELLERVGIIDIRDKPLALMDMKLLAVAGDDAGRFLSAMLQRIQTKIGEIGRFLVAVNAEDGTFVVKLVGTSGWEVLCSYA